MYRWYQPTIGRYTRPDPEDMSRCSDQLAFSYARGNPLRSIDNLGLRVEFVSPAIQPYLDCAMQHPSVKEVWFNWIEKEAASWSIESSGQCPRGVDTSCWTPPSRIPFFTSPGKVILNPQSSSCKDVVRDLVHELAEIYANRGPLQYSTNALFKHEIPIDPVGNEWIASPAHNYARKADRAADWICCQCSLR